jgi:class 3 adenylate cyclase/tetratricopeptide (TPR) repeat protein
MTFQEILAQVITWLQREHRVSYRALKRQFNLDDDYIADLKEELVYAKRLAVDEEGRVLVWTGDAGATAEPSPQPASPSVLQGDRSTAAAAPPTVSHALEAERRQLTVLFCDLADSTRLSRQLDPEDLREVIRAYQATCVDVIQRFAGYVAQYLGDGLLVYFGYPQAHEDDVQRAVRAGLGILEAMGTLNGRLERDQDTRLAVRIGIHTGQVVVGEIGSGGRHEHLALGETPNIAARLQGLAAPDTVVISAATDRLVHGYFTRQDNGVHVLKGIETPVQVYQVLEESTAQSRLEVTGTTGLTPLVGRETEVTLLLERWAQARDGLGQVVLLSGEAGIGKSRLVRVLTEQVMGEGAPRLRFRCSPYHTNSALYPVIEHLQQRWHFQREDAPQARLDKLEHGIGTYGFPPEKVVPLFASLLSVPLLDHYAPLHLSPEQQKQKTLELLVTWLLKEAEQQPVLTVWEDLHWADPSTLELLSLLLNQTPTTRLLHLLTCRPEFQPPWSSRAHLTPLTLTRLSRPQVEAMVGRISGGKALPAEMLELVVAKTDGVPLFVEELIKAVLESGVLRETDGHYELTGPLASLAIPTTLHDSLMARLDRLTTAKAVAQLGATLGRQFSYDLLQAVSPLDEAMLQRELGRLMEAELLYQRGVLPHATYLFKHALIQDAAYQSLLKSTRQQYHQRIAQVLTERFPETAETQPEVVAQHYTAAGLHAQALPYWQRAGQLAIERSANREAVASLEKGLEAVTHLPQNRATLEQAVDLRLALRMALRPLGDSGRMLSALREAESLAAALDDHHRLGQVLVSLSAYSYNDGSYDQAIAAGERGLTLAMARGDVVLQALVNLRLGQAYYRQCDYRRAIDYLRQAVAFFDGTRQRERFGLPNLPAVLSRTFLAWCYAELGAFAEGSALGEEGLQIAEAVAHPTDLMMASWGPGLLSLRQGDLDRALSLLERAVGICHEADLPGYFTEMAATLGVAYTLGGRVADAIALLTQALEQAIARERVGDQMLCRLSLGEAQMLAGRLEEAHALAECALTHARERQARGPQAYALRLLGDIAARRKPSDIEHAEAHYRQAHTLAGELGMHPLQAHCHHDLGTLYAKIGRPEQARTELSAAIDLYRPMEMTFWLPQAEAMLAQVS